NAPRLRAAACRDTLLPGPGGACLDRDGRSPDRRTEGGPPARPEIPAPARIEGDGAGQPDLRLPEVLLRTAELLVSQGRRREPRQVGKDAAERASPPGTRPVRLPEGKSAAVGR